MVASNHIQAVVMAGGKGSRMTDLTAGGAKCLLPVGNLPLLWFPLHMLQKSGFQTAIVVVPDSVKTEVSKIPEKYNLNIRLEVVEIPAQEEWGTADTLRRIHDKLVASDILVVSGDLVSQESISCLADLHRANAAGLTILLNRPAFHLDQIQVPGSKSTKYKRERDLVGLCGPRLCLFKAEADVEDEIKIAQRILRENGRITVHTNLQDAHLYLFKRWVCDFVASDRSISTIKGELLPKLVGLQFKQKNKTKLFEVPEGSPSGCFAVIGERSTLRVNNIPAYWEVCGLMMGRQLFPDASIINPLHASARVGDKAQIKDCMIGAGCMVSDKTSLSNVALGANCFVGEKARLANSVIMEGSKIEPGVIIQDSIICDSAVLGEGCEVRSCIVGRGLILPSGSSHHNQILLDTDRMMEV